MTKSALKAEWLVTPDPDKPNWKDYAICALASAAFPVGLAPRLIGATLGKDSSPAEKRKDEYEGRRWPIDLVASDLTRGPAWLDTVRAEAPFWFTTADGGIIDNDPFEYARFSLKDGGKLDQGIEHRLNAVDRAVIMVSPFPELKPIAPEGRPASDLVSSFSALMPALIAQARFKPSEIILAARSTHGSRYLIGPSRVTPDGKEQRLWHRERPARRLRGVRCAKLPRPRFSARPPQLPAFFARNVRTTAGEQNHRKLAGGRR